MTTSWHALKKYLINYFILHIFLSLVSLPILVAWGLPSSWLSPLGNMLFNPLLSIFLLISSLAFFSELLGIPHALLDWVLEYLTLLWHWLLKLAPNSVLYGFHGASWLLLGCIALIALVSIMHPIMRHPTRRLAGLTFLFIISMAILRAHEPSSLTYHMPCNRGSVAIIRSHNITIVIDPGYIGSRLSASSWISYTFMPELIAKTGSLIIDHLILLKPSIVTFEAIDTLLQNAQIHHLYMPYMQGELEGSLKRSFGRLYAHSKQNNIPITCLFDKKCELLINDSTTFLLNPNGTKTYKTICYPHFVIEGKANDKIINITGR